MIVTADIFYFTLNKLEKRTREQCGMQLLEIHIDV